MKKLVFVLLSIVYADVYSQSKNDIEGLWLVTEVQVGNKTMTPNAKWTRFNADGTQQSGNGWVQHSKGTWSFNETSNELLIENENGLKDPFVPFRLNFDGEVMLWEREEEGSLVIVKLRHIEALPMTFNDQMLGLWKLKKAEGAGLYFSETDEENGDYLFVKWTGKFELRSGGNKTYGVYNVHAHKPEIELIPYGEDVNRSYWTIDFSEGEIKLNLLNTPESVTREFIRVREYPN